MKPLKPVLLAEDDANDVFLMQRAFRLVEIPIPLKPVENGQQAIDYLTLAAASPESHPLPCLVLLDLKMPLQSGLDVLKWIRSTPATALIPVLMLTSSGMDIDIHRAYILGANGYLTKPGKPDDLVALVKGIRDFWLSQNYTPETGAFYGAKPYSVL